jgi:hypothetical protein
MIPGGPSEAAKELIKKLADVSVEDGIATVQHRGIEGADVALNDFDGVGDLGQPLGAEIELVEDANCLAFGQQLAYGDAADVAGSAGNENFSRSHGV